MKLQCWNFIWWSTRRVWLVKTFEFTPIKEGIGSTHRGILETYTTSFNSKYHQLKSRAWLRKQRIQFTKGIMYPREGPRGYWIWGMLSDKIHKRSGGPQGIWREQRYSTRRRKNARRSDYRNNWLIQSSNAKELWFLNQGIRSNALSRDG